MLRILFSLGFLYFGTVIVSFLLIGIAIIFIQCSKRKEYIYSKYGIREFFSSNNGGERIYTLLLIPIVNIFLSFMALLVAVTDIGDDF